MRTYEHLSKRFAENRLLSIKVSALLSVYGLTPGEWIVLGYIHDGYTSVARISEQYETSKAYITKTVNDLEDYGWVKRRPSKKDQRGKEVKFIGSEEWKFARIEEAIQAIL